MEQPFLGCGDVPLSVKTIKTSINGRLWTWRDLLFFLFLCGFSSHLRFFHSYGDVTIAGEGLQIFTARHSWPLSSIGSLACHIYCGTGHPFIMFIRSGAVTTYFFRLRSVAAGIRTLNLPLAKRTLEPTAPPPRWRDLYCALPTVTLGSASCGFIQKTVLFCRLSRQQNDQWPILNQIASGSEEVRNVKVDTVQRVQARENEWWNSSLLGVQKALKTMTNLWCWPRIRSLVRSTRRTLFRRKHTQSQWPHPAVKTE